MLQVVPIFNFIISMEIKTSNSVSCIIRIMDFMRLLILRLVSLLMRMGQELGQKQMCNYGIGIIAVRATGD